MTCHCICSQNNQFPDNGKIYFNLLEVRINTDTLQFNTICIANAWLLQDAEKNVECGAMLPNSK